jgi:hypothetical protein
MIKKILIIAAMVLIIVMIRIAGASNIEVLGDGITIDKNLDGDHFVTIDTDGYVVDHFNITGSLDKFTVKINNVEKNPELINGILTITIPSAISGSKYNFTFVNDKGAPDGKYLINYNLMWNKVSSTRNAYIYAGVNVIPEFPKVALPIAVVIGFVFCLQQRKNKEI